MVQRIKTLLCAGALILSLAAAYVQEATWTGETKWQQQPVPPVITELFSR